MGRIVVSEFVTLDGVAQSPEAWFPAFWSQEVQAFKDREQLEAACLLLGRTTCNIFAESWPGRTGALADSINTIRKHVVSSRPYEGAWPNVMIHREVNAQSVTALTNQVSGTLLVVGSLKLVNALLAWGSVDELRLIVSPVLVGAGARLFQSEHRGVTFASADAQSFPNGVTLLRYCR